ncbi:MULTISPECIES: hypothetical protein [unclassified Sphingopyxis]|uniref:hypothetical protein n=1 Tax=unclassified Sphingopyxis TaxID=2614943 RepID=UPI000736752A|nr:MULTISPECIES: hypothetical protein [unclassified Sphingopyxis]KTE34622.1 hypothetical protein ATE62_15930 [Sphingopyxis sp. HIX]
MDRRDAALAEIAEAFAGRGLAPGDPLFAVASPELDQDRFSGFARPGGWADIPWQALCGNAIALALATPAGFAFLLPAAMTASLAHYAECGALTSMLLTCLTPEDAGDAEAMADLERDFEALEPGFLGEGAAGGLFGADDAMQRAFVRRVALLSVPERAAVRAWLVALDDRHGADFPMFGPREALGRFWAAPDRGGQP